MKFPGYVPAGVQDLVTRCLNDDSLFAPSLLKQLTQAKQRLESVDIALQKEVAKSICRPQEPGRRKVAAKRKHTGVNETERTLPIDYLSWVRREHIEASEAVERISGRIECLKKLAIDRRMKEAFAALTGEFTDDDQWECFILAAWVANKEYGSVRNNLKHAGELARSIAVAAENLSKLLGGLRERSSEAPNELFSVLALLQTTENSDIRGDKGELWRRFRDDLFGDQIRRAIEVPVPDGASAREHVRGHLRYVWLTCPGLPDLLGRMSEVAKSYTPGERGHIAAAIQSRQSNKRTEYLRAFASLLVEEHGFVLSAPIRTAMAVAATVVINCPKDSVVSSEDVRKALGRYRTKRSENSPTK
jgi:hypothetical protein